MLALKSIFSIISNCHVQEYAAKAILEYPVYSESEVDEQIIVHDMSMLDTIFPRPVDTTDFIICEILHHFEKVCSTHGLDWPSSLPQSSQNITYKFYTTLNEEYYHEIDKIEDAESRRVEAIEQIAVNASLKELDYIESNYNDRVSMSFLFGVVCNLPEEQRLSAVMIFCKCNPDFDAFRNIHIMPTHASWSGSEVPIIEQYIAFLIKFRENLKGIQFIEHRAYISEEIQDLQKRKEEVLLREFLEER